MRETEVRRRLRFVLMALGPLLERAADPGRIGAVPPRLRLKRVTFVTWSVSPATSSHSVRRAGWTRKRLRVAAVVRDQATDKQGGHGRDNVALDVTGLPGEEVGASRSKPPGGTFVRGPWRVL